MSIEDFAPPPGLVANTVARVAEHICQDLPSAPKETSIARPMFERPWWRRVDVLVAASIAVTVVGLLLPGLFHLRVMGVQVDCENNLRELWNGLSAYQTQKNQLPDVATAPRAVAGMVVPMLRDAGVLSPTALACCPGAAAGACLNIGLHDLAAMPGSDFDKTAAKLLPGYAYSLGYREGDQLHGPVTRLPDVASAQIPLLADAPASPVGFGNSPNHAGRGQNVLYSDGHIAFKTLRTAGIPGDDIYLNQANKVAAGLGQHDIVLGTGNAAP